MYMENSEYAPSVLSTHEDFSNHHSEGSCLYFHDQRGFAFVGEVEF